MENSINIEIHLTIANNLKSDNIEIMICDKVDEVMKKLLN